RRDGCARDSVTDSRTARGAGRIRGYPERPVDGRALHARSALLQIQLCGPRTHDDLYFERDRSAGRVDDADAAVLELARRRPALDLSDDPAQQPYAVDSSHHLDFAAWHVPDGCRTLSRDR